MDHHTSPPPRTQAESSPNEVAGLSHISVLLRDSRVQTPQPSRVLVELHAVPTNESFSAATRGQHVFRADRDTWIRLRTICSISWRPVQPEDVPLLLRRIADALDQNSERG